VLFYYQNLSQWLIDQNQVLRRIFSPNWSQVEVDSVKSILTLRKSLYKEINTNLSSFLSLKEDANLGL
jgi:hypothetical protein